MRIRVRALLLLVCLFGCESDRNNRLSLETSRRAQIVDEYTEVSVSGGTFITVEQAISSNANTSVLRFISRAESLKPVFRVRTTDCQPRVIHFAAFNLEPSGTDCQFSALRQAEKAVDRAGRQLLDAFGRNDAVGSTAPGTYLVRPSQCQTTLNEDGALHFSVCLDWSTGLTDVRPGHIRYEDCFDVVSRATCLEQTLGMEPTVASAGLEAEIQLTTANDADLVVAAVANLEPNESVIEALAADLKSERVDFVVVVGDLTNNGSVSEAERITALLDRHLEMPWFATLGDQDIEGNLGNEYLGLFGSASSAFDVSGVRFVLLDSANGGLKEPSELLDHWLSDVELDGVNSQPIQHLVFTHYPPFARVGGADPQFEHSFEAGALLARLTAIKSLGLVVGQRKVAGNERIGAVNIFHVGRLTDGARGAWSKFTIDSACVALCNERQDICNCMQYERMR